MKNISEQQRVTVTVAKLDTAVIIHWTALRLGYSDRKNTNAGQKATTQKATVIHVDVDSV